MYNSPVTLMMLQNDMQRRMEETGPRVATPRTSKKRSRRLLGSLGIVLVSAGRYLVRTANS